MQQKSLEYQSSLIIFMYVFNFVSDTLEWFGIFLALNLLLKSWTMAFRQVYTKKEVWPKVVLKRLSLSLTHPYHCTKCPQRFHKIYEATEHYLNSHQNSNDLPKEEIRNETKIDVRPYKLVWPQWWSFADVSQQGLHFSKKISKIEIFFWFDFHRCSHESSKRA